MKLNHLNLTVTDVPQTATFLEKYFGMRRMGGNNNIALLSDDHGMVLTLTNMKVGRETEVKYPATFHVGFAQESEERVNEINKRLKDDGFEDLLLSCPRRFHHRGPRLTLSRRRAS